MGCCYSNSKNGGQAGGWFVDKVKDHSARLPTLPGLAFFVFKLGPDLIRACPLLFIGKEQNTRPDADH